MTTATRQMDCDARSCQWCGCELLEHEPGDYCDVCTLDVERDRRERHRAMRPRPAALGDNVIPFRRRSAGSGWKGGGNTVA